MRGRTAPPSLSDSDNRPAGRRRQVVCGKLHSLALLARPRRDDTDSDDDSDGGAGADPDSASAEGDGAVDTAGLSAGSQGGWSARLGRCQREGARVGGYQLKSRLNGARLLRRDANRQAHDGARCKAGGGRRDAQHLACR